MPLAVDHDDRDFAFALAQGVASAKIRADRAHDLRQLWVVDPDLVRARQPAARLDQRAIGVLLLRRHPLVRGLGIAAEGRLLGHPASPLVGGYSHSIDRPEAGDEALISASFARLRLSAAANAIANHSHLA